MVLESFARLTAAARRGWRKEFLIAKYSELSEHCASAVNTMSVPSVAVVFDLIAVGVGDVEGALAAAAFDSDAMVGEFLFHAF